MVKKLENTNAEEDQTAKEEKAVKEAMGSDAEAMNANDSLYVHKLSRPVEYDGKKYEELTFDFDSLTGGDSMDVEDELARQNHPVITRSIDTAYLTRMCARACTASIGWDIFRLMAVRDCNRITNISRRFF